MKLILGLLESLLQFYHNFFPNNLFNKINKKLFLNYHSWAMLCWCDITNLSYFVKWHNNEWITILYHYVDMIQLLEFGDPNSIWSNSKSLCEVIIMRFFFRVYGGSRGIRRLNPIVMMYSFIYVCVCVCVWWWWCIVLELWWWLYFCCNRSQLFLLIPILWQSESSSPLSMVFPV